MSPINSIHCVFELRTQQMLRSNELPYFTVHCIAHCTSCVSAFKQKKKMFHTPVYFKLRQVENKKVYRSKNNLQPKISIQRRLLELRNFLISFLKAMATTSPKISNKIQRKHKKAPVANTHSSHLFHSNDKQTQTV